MTDSTSSRWKRLSTKPIYENPWLSLREDVVELPDGRSTIYGVVTDYHQRTSASTRGRLSFRMEMSTEERSILRHASLLERPRGGPR